MSKPLKESITLHNKLSESERMHTAWQGFAEQCKLDEETYNELRLVIEETFVNIVNYGFKKGEDSSITVEISELDNRIHFTFIDDGIAFNPITDCATGVGAADLCDGGMGIHLIKSLTDEQHYQRNKQQNVFTVTKLYTKVS